MSIKNDRLMDIIRHAIVAYFYELDQQDYETDDEMFRVLLNEFNMTEYEFDTIMGCTFEQCR